MITCEVFMPIVDPTFKPLTLENVNRAPRKRGVYALYADKTLVFLGQAEGRSDTIRSRLRGHLEGRTDGPMRYKREPAANPAARLKTLLLEHVKKHGHLPAQNARTV
jgi:hypothetical protein